MNQPLWESDMIGGGWGEDSLLTVLPLVSSSSPDLVGTEKSLVLEGPEPVGALGVSSTVW